MTGTTTSVERELAALLGADALRPADTAEYLSDATESRALRGRADAIVLPRDREQVADVVRWCYAHDVALIPRGGGTGLAGGAVPVDGGVVVSLERMHTVRELEPGLWRAHVEAGLRTAELARYARENGVYYPPDPGAAEQSQIGGNIATNAGGPHSLKYGVTGAWVTGLELVMPPGEVVSVGGVVRKDVAGYDLKSLMIGSEGTLGIVTAAWLRLIPAPAAELAVVAFYGDLEAGGQALTAVMGSGVEPAVLEFLDQGALEVALPSFPGQTPAAAAFALIVSADGSESEAERQRTELLEVLGVGSACLHLPTGRPAIQALWRWRSGVSGAVTARRGGKVSEDIAVPVERLTEAVSATREIGRRHGLEACSWGHAGDGNLHSTFMIDRSRPEELERAEAAAQELFALAVSFGGTVSGEHGLGLVKRGALSNQWSPAALRAHASLKDLFDPKGLMNPGKKVACPPAGA